MLEKRPQFPEDVSIPDKVLMACLSERARKSNVDLENVSVTYFLTADSSLKDRIPRVFGREYIGRGDKHTEETVSFVLGNGEIIPDAVLQEWDYYVDEAGESPYKKAGKRIGEVLSRWPNTRYVAVHTWNFDGGQSSKDPVIDTHRLDIFAIK